MKGLMMHCGAEAIVRSELANVMPTKVRGAYHNPVPYIEFVEEITDNLNAIGFSIQTEGFGITKNGDRFFGLLELKSDFTDYAPMLGLRGSYDSTLPRGMALGSGVFVCDNLCFSGDVTFKTRQTTNIRQRLPYLVRNAIEQIPEMVQVQDQKFTAYKNTELKPRHGDAAIIELVRRKAITPSQVGRAIEEWDLPKHEEHNQYGDSIWKLHNAVTEAIKPTNADNAVVVNNIKRTTILTSFLDEVVGL